MVSIILAIVLGIGFTFIATQNTGIIPINLAGVTYMFPLYVLAAALFLLGMLVAFLFHLMDKTAEIARLRHKDANLETSVQTNRNLQNQIQKLTTENAELRERLDRSQTDLQQEKIQSTKAGARNVIDRIRHSFT
jgi:cell shape-determining protein MreC